MIQFLKQEEIEDILKTDEAEIENFGVLYKDGDSVDCITLVEACRLMKVNGGEIYIYGGLE